MKIIECPRDAVQGISKFIPTAAKISYLNELLKAGFDTLDFGSFVSPKAVPQVSDTAEVIRNLDLNGSPTKLLAIVANERGARQACEFKAISYIGYPFSVSEIFQRLNSRATVEDSFEQVKSIQKLCLRHGKQLVIYISWASVTRTGTRGAQQS
jgi:hydroxymethylglutaryl-CoA lyase